MVFLVQFVIIDMNKEHTVLVDTSFRSMFRGYIR